MTPIGDLFGRLDLRAARCLRAAEVNLVLLGLMQDLQLHRGLSCAVLDGQSGFNGELVATASKLQRSLHALADQYGDKHLVFVHAEWRLVLDRWEALHGNWRQLDFYTGLTAHSELILGLVAILKLLAEENTALLGRARAQVIVTWPPMVEHLDMLRALGLHTLGRAGMPEDVRIRPAMVNHACGARRTLTTVARSVHEDGMVASTEAVLRRVARIIDTGAEAEATQGYHAAMTSVIDHWYWLIRSRILKGAVDPPTAYQPPAG